MELLLLRFMEICNVLFRSEHFLRVRACRYMGYISSVLHKKVIARREVMD